jgi:hypothetical protein
MSYVLSWKQIDIECLVLDVIADRIIGAIPS